MTRRAISGKPYPAAAELSVKYIVVPALVLLAAYTVAQHPQEASSLAAGTASH